MKIQNIFKIIEMFRSSYRHGKIWYLSGLIFLLAIGFFSIYNRQKSTKESSDNSTTQSSSTGDDYIYQQPTGGTESGQDSTVQSPSDSPSTSKSSSSSSSTQKSNPSSQAPSSQSSGNNPNTDEKPDTPEPTSPETPSATVAFYADTQTDNNPVGEETNHQQVVNYILNTSANPVFHAGDLMENGTQASLDSFNSVTATLRASRSFYSAIGNNERNSALYFNNFSFPGNERWYSVNSGNLHMVILDSAYSATNAEQLAWLRADLQSAASQDRITGVMFHHPGDYSDLADFIFQSLVDYGVDFVINGHIHNYSHTTSSGIHFFTLSGQQSIGYILAMVYQNNISFTVYNSNNQVIDNITFDER